MDKWICKRCGNVRQSKPRKNEICNLNGCKGRFQKYHVCKICGEWFLSHDATVCQKCAENGFRKSHGSSVGIICEECGKQFRRPIANAKGKKQFCSLKCLRTYEQRKWIDRTCRECGKTFRVLKSSIEKTNASGNYCSWNCYTKAQHIEGSHSWKGGFERIKRENFGGVQFCAICGTTKKIHIHHIIPFRYTHDNSIDNLIPLCASHHSQIEHIWLPFIQTFENPNNAKPYIQNVLRSRQKATLNIIKKLINERGEPPSVGK